MRLLFITLIAVATAFGTSYGLQSLYPKTVAAIDPDDQPITVEQVLEATLNPAPLPAGSRLMRVNDLQIDVAPPEQGRLSEDMDEPSTVAASDDGLTEDVLQLEALAEAVPDEDITEVAETTDAATPGTIEVAERVPAVEATPTPPPSKAAPRTASDVDMSAGANRPTIAPTQARSTPEATQPRELAMRDDNKAEAKAVQDERPISTPRPLAATQLPSTRPLADDTMVTVPDTNTPRATAAPAPARSAPTPPPQRARAAAPPPPSGVEPEAWWSRPTTSEQLGVIHVGTASFNRAIVMMTDGGFTSVRSVASHVEVLRDGIVVSGQWTISPANNHVLIFPLADAGRYDITIGTGLQDRNGRLWPHTVRGSIDIP